MRTGLFRLLGLITLLLVVHSPTYARPTGSVEIGMDGGIEVISFDDVDTGSGTLKIDNATEINFPVQSFRVGVFATEQLQIEPSLGFAFVSQSGESAHQLALGLDLIHNFGADPDRATPFLGFGGQILNVEHDASATQGSVRGRFGVKLPAGNRMAMRLQGAVSRGFKNDDFYGSWTLAALFGISFFTR